MVAGTLSRIDCNIQIEGMEQRVDDCVLHNVSTGMAQPVDVFEI